ncbi:unnamed protein product [Sphacelaria rigidula]
MVYLKNKPCGKEGCFKRSSFGAAGGKKEFCATHARAGMVDVQYKQCGKEGCSRRPSFGAAGGKKAEFCATHSRADMVDVRSKRCGKEDCSKHASFGAAGGRKKEFCATHARAGMIHVKNKQCGKESCPTLPSFGAAGGEKAEFFATHARAGMIDVRSKRCGKEDCSNHALQEVDLCATPARQGSVKGSDSASHGCSNRVREHGNTCRLAAHGLAMASDAARHIQEKIIPSDGSTLGEAGVGFDGHGERLDHPSGAGPTTSDGGCTSSGRRSSRITRATRRDANSITTPPVALGQPPGAAAPDRVPLGEAETCIEMKIDATVAPTGVVEEIRTSGEQATALSCSCDSTGNGGSSNITRNRSFGSRISSVRNTKRPRRAVDVEPVFDVATGHDVMSEEEGDGVKLELDVSNAFRDASAALSRP